MSSGATRALSQAIFFNRSGAAQQVPDAGFRGTDRQRRCALASPIPDGDGLCAVVHRRARAMSVEVINAFGSDAGALTSHLHNRQRRFALRVWLSKVVLVDGRAVADDFTRSEEHTS